MGQVYDYIFQNKLNLPPLLLLRVDRLQVGTGRG